MQGSKTGHLDKGQARAKIKRGGRAHGCVSYFPKKRKEKDLRQANDGSYSVNQRNARNSFEERGNRGGERSVKDRE
jgi:hypothetical protein